MTDLALLVLDCADDVAGIRRVTLADPDGAELPSFTPGSHLMLCCGPVTNAYSLTGPNVAPLSYTISVQRLDDGHGGSAWIHDTLKVGDTVAALLPRSSFAPVRHARRHLYLAAGIGITPIVSHLRAAARWGDDVELLYLHRRGAGAYLDELDSLTSGKLRTYTGRDSFLDDLDKVLGDQPIGTHGYLCGPPAFMDAVLGVAADLGWPPGRLHLEHFGVGVLDPGMPFEVDINGQLMTVPAGESLLTALERAGHQVPNMCRQGVCGECRVGVLAGDIEHRDLYLDESEKASGTSMMCCVSRAAGSSLVLAL